MVYEFDLLHHTKISALIKGLQSGKVQNYAMYFFGGIAGLAVLFICLWKALNPNGRLGEEQIR
jgi:hypothetical protein